VWEVDAAESVRAQIFVAMSCDILSEAKFHIESYRMVLTIFVSLLVPRRVRAGVLWLLLLLAALIEHVEEVELRGDWKNEDQQSTDHRL